MYLSGGRVSDNLTGSPLALRLDKLQNSVPGCFFLTPAPLPAWLLWSLPLATTSSFLNTGQLLTWLGEPWLCCLFILE